MENRQSIENYFDYAATTPVLPEVVAAMQVYWGSEFGNPGSVHQWGQSATRAIDGARSLISSYFGCKVSEIYFTSGATESNNIVLQGILKPGDHVIVSSIEHAAILDILPVLKEGGVECDIMRVNDSGIIDLNHLESLIKDSTRLISVMAVNNEIGTIQPLSQIRELVDALNNVRSSQIYVHTDAAQAFPYCDAHTMCKYADLISFSAHKIYGPKGIGGLYIKQKTHIKPVMHGGGQELGLRPGTESVPLIVGMAKAFELLAEYKSKLGHLSELQTFFIDKLEDAFGNDIQFHGTFDQGQRIQTNINFSIKGVDGDSLVVMLDQQGFGTSAGSACSAHSSDVSHVIISLGVSQEAARGSVRISFGYYTTRESVEKLVNTIITNVSK